MIIEAEDRRFAFVKIFAEVIGPLKEQICKVKEQKNQEPLKAENQQAD